MVQINYQRYVLGFKPEDKNLLYASSQGQVKHSTELADNLIEIIRLADEERNMIEDDGELVERQFDEDKFRQLGG